MAIGTGAAILGASAIGALAGGKGGNTTSTQNSNPWYGQTPYLLDINQRAQNQSFGSGIADQSPTTLQAQQLQSQRALQGNPLNQAAQNLNLATMRGDYTDLSKNPAAQNAMNMARSQINSQFGGDNYGNSAHQEWLSRGLMQAAAPFYESERQRQTGAMALAPTLANQDYTDISQLGNVGLAQDARKQQELEAPWMNLERYRSLISGNGGTTSTQQPYFTNPLATGLGMGIGGLGLYNAMNQGGLMGGQATPLNNFAYNGMGVGGYQYG